MEPNTHLAIDARLCGTPVQLAPGRAQVRLTTLPEMAADDRGLVHGGFVFGLADYAAMLAVNDPNVVLGSAELRFTRPVCVGEVVEAVAEVSETKGKKRVVTVTARALEAPGWRAAWDEACRIVALRTEALEGPSADLEVAKATLAVARAGAADPSVAEAEAAPVIAGLEAARDRAALAVQAAEEALGAAQAVQLRLDARAERVVMEGTLTAFVLEKHVLD